MAQRDSLTLTYQGEAVSLATPEALAANLEAQLVPLVRRWNRLEGRPRAADFDQSVRAEIRDPLWNLSKQWQVGEFIGEDVGSPMQAAIHIEKSAFQQFGAGAHPLEEFDDSEPLEMRVERQPIGWAHGDRVMHLDLRLALGRRWSKMLDRAGLGGSFGEYLTLYPVTAPNPDDLSHADLTAHSTIHQHIFAVAGRAMDGGALFLYLMANAANAASDNIAGLSGAEQTTINGLGDRFVLWVNTLIDTPDDAQNGWRAARLEYAARMTTEQPGGPALFEDETLTAEEIYDGRLDWYHFDREPPTVRPSPDPLTDDPTVFIPTTLEFDGMPHPRWWQFEEGAVNFGAVDPSTSDLGKLLFMEHMLLYANDWFLFPYRVRAGSNALVRGLSVTNVFGERYWIEATGARSEDSWQGWGLFANSATDDVTDTSDRHVTVLPTAAKIQDAEAQEVQWLVRDEIANSVWAIEQQVRTPTGEMRRGAELARETRKFFKNQIAAPTGSDTETDARHRYNLMTRVPEHWIPFVPVHKENDNRRTKLQRAAMPRVLEGDPELPVRIRPRTELMRQGLAETPRDPLFIENEEVPRAGVQVFDGFRRTRWYNGQTFVWRGIQKRVGRGEGSSGLAFDQLLPKRARRRDSFAGGDPAEATTPTVGHPPIDITLDPPPTVALAVHPDPMAGWTLQITPQNHSLAPQNASTPHIEGEGHIHLYVNGIKVARLYEPWVHLPPLLPGTVEITVELSANSHAPLAVEGKPVSASVTVDQTAVAAMMHPMGEEVVTDPGAPTVTITVHEDPVSGYNLQVQLGDFTLSPTGSGGGHVAGEGHLHLFVNDVKAARLYGNWHHLPALGGGTHTVKVALYTNDHRPYVKDGAAIADEVEIEVAGGPGVAAGHTHP